VNTGVKAKNDKMISSADVVKLATPIIISTPVQ